MSKRADGARIFDGCAKLKPAPDERGSAQPQKDRFTEAFMIEFSIRRANRERPIMPGLRKRDCAGIV